MDRRLFSSLIALAGLAVTVPCFANPEPDIPVTLRLEPGGECVITAEVDPRCFTDEPIYERYLMKVDVDTRSGPELDATKAQVAEALGRWVSIRFQPTSVLLPKPQLSFSGIAGAKLDKFDAPVVVLATWRFKAPPELKSWQVSALPGGRFSVLVKTLIHGTLAAPERTLFPGETTPAMLLPQK